ncbi:Hypothetical protein CINCED_3A022518 [Cinara cedri]|uniref:Uncharacterized protein n=1 Tax=Cinara cedri TaxID=506608 RepID=A0A5E4MMW0_9HEMI|nr:Hypothetical protein CINCED_3A022518 [Cinara cedri]
MPRLKRMGMNIHQLRQVFELENEEESKNFTQCHPARPLMYHLLFTFAIITATSILGIIVEHERKINTQLWSNLLQMFKEIIFEESSVLRFWKSQSSGEQAFACLTLIHFAVYLAWDIRWKSSIMSNYFIINEGFIKTWPYVLTGMSGNRFLHYMCIEEFFVFYISACVFSSLSKVYMERKFNTVSKNKHGAVSILLLLSGSD